MSTKPMMPELPEKHYLNETYGIRSWLLTTDHKRIALLYLFSVTLFFFIGGFFAMIIRLHLLTPSGYLLSAETYNRMFTMHGVAMIFFFLIPSIPAVLGNFLVPLMIGAKDLAFPKINLLSWYVYVVGGVFTLYSMVNGGLDTGWTFYTPLSTVYLELGGSAGRRRRVHHRVFLDSYWPEFPGDHPHDARAGNDLVSPAALHLGAVRHQPWS